MLVLRSDAITTDVLMGRLMMGSGERVIAASGGDLRVPAVFRRVLEREVMVAEFDGV